LLLKVLIADTFSAKAREQILNQAVEERNVIKDELWHVHITESSHEHQIFWLVSVLTLKLTCHNQD
jgi:hypothetical protein